MTVLAFCNVLADILVVTITGYHPFLNLIAKLTNYIRVIVIKVEKLSSLTFIQTWCIRWRNWALVNFFVKRKYILLYKLNCKVAAVSFWIHKHLDQLNRIKRGYGLLKLFQTQNLLCKIHLIGEVDLRDSKRSKITFQWLYRYERISIEVPARFLHRLLFDVLLINLFGILVMCEVIFGAFVSLGCLISVKTQLEFVLLCGTRGFGNVHVRFCNQFELNNISNTQAWCR